jgi:hypothetical protein
MSNIIEALTETVRGRVITRSDSDYDEARAVYNAMHDCKPRAVIQCVDSADVMAAVAAGRDACLDLAIRGGDSRFASRLQTGRWTSSSRLTSRVSRRSGWAMPDTRRRWKAEGSLCTVRQGQPRRRVARSRSPTNQCSRASGMSPSRGPLPLPQSSLRPFL